jgi:hypothetical protein
MIPIPDLEKPFRVDDAEHVEQILAPFYNRLVANLNARADERAKSRWMGMSKGLREYEKAHYVETELRYQSYELQRMRDAIRACLRFSLIFEVNEKGLRVTKGLELLPEKHELAGHIEALEIFKRKLNDTAHLLGRIRDDLYFLYKNIGATFSLTVDGITMTDEQELTERRYKLENQARIIEHEKNVLVQTWQLIDKGGVIE